ncbi:MAG TPA: N-acetyltransferase [Devosia sp.]|nr:N-acetyltransferase [Devosia sp.]
MLALWTRKNGPVLNGGGQRLRLPVKADFEAWRDLRTTSREFLRPFEPKWSRLDLTRSNFGARLRRINRDAKAAREFSFFLFDIEAGSERLVGGVTLSNIRYRAACHANIGYWVGVDDAGKGHMSAAVGLCLPFVFDQLALRRLHAACLPENAASRRVLEKNGFVEEGFAEHFLQIAGEWRDHVLYGLTTQRYNAKKETT